MKNAKKWLGSLVLSLFAVGCALSPLGPSVLAMPAVNKPMQLFQQEEKDCRDYAMNQMGGEQAVAREQQNAVAHGLIGAFIGAAAGGLIGAGAGNAGAGAGIGAGSGLIVGTASGAVAAQGSMAKLQQLYDNAYLQCMYAKGNQVSNRVQ